MHKSNSRPAFLDKPGPKPSGPTSILKKAQATRTRAADTLDTRQWGGSDPSYFESFNYPNRYNVEAAQGSGRKGRDHDFYGAVEAAAG